MVYDPEETAIFSLNEYISIAFCSVQCISPLDWDFEAQLPSTFAYGLLPCCLRLTAWVTPYRPRLAMNGLLNLVQWGSHPLYDVPLAWRTYRPPVSPLSLLQVDLMFPSIRDLVDQMLHNLLCQII